jgi:DnaK suppressor protein
MQKRLLQELKQKLQEEKEATEKELGSFAKKDPHLKGDWDSVFPRYDGGTGGEILEDAADEVEEYATRLPIEYTLELRLQDIDLALKKMKKGKYGICENCRKKISQERLKVYPEARFCIKCRK